MRVRSSGINGTGVGERCMKGRKARPKIRTNVAGRTWGWARTYGMDTIAYTFYPRFELPWMYLHFKSVSKEMTE